MTENFDYSGYETVPDEESLGVLNTLIQEAVRLKLEMDEKEEAFKAASKRYKELAERTLPDTMERLDMQSYTTTDGKKVSLKRTKYSSPPKDRYPEALKWLEDNGHAGIIKRKFEIRFNRDEQAWANKFMADLRRRKKQVDLKHAHWVEPQTLSKFVRDAEVDGEDVPHDLFGVYEKRTVKVG